MTPPEQESMTLPRSLVQPLRVPPRPTILTINLQGGVRGLNRTYKRWMDVVLASAILLALSPLLLLIALMIVLESSGSALYRQQRRGWHQKPFWILKFRTMRANTHNLRATLFPENPSEGVHFKLKRDPRVTRVGRILRRFSIDEVPQLLNVLRGEMSLVGPRPFSLVVFERQLFDHQMFESWVIERHSVRPGLTGLWQVNGRSDLPFPELVRLDLQYVRNWSPWLDLSILLRTFRAVLARKGAY